MDVIHTEGHVPTLDTPSTTENTPRKASRGATKARMTAQTVKHITQVHTEEVKNLGLKLEHDHQPWRRSKRKKLDRKEATGRYLGDRFNTMWAGR